MNVRSEDRPARSPLAEGLSMLPYLQVYQRMHRRRWQWGAAAIALGIAALWLARRR